MIYYVSPTKTLKPTEIQSNSKLLFPQKTKQLKKELKNLTKVELAAFYGASDKIVNHQFNAIHNPTPLGPSGYVYQGEVFRQLDLKTIHNNYLADKLYIGSALYGITQIETNIEDHRLDFTKHLNEINLVEFWSKSIQKVLKNKGPIINLSSQEYSQLLSGLDYITIHFLDDGKVKSTYAKSARGAFLRECALFEIKNIDQLKRINVLNYKFNKELSDVKNLVFTR